MVNRNNSLTNIERFHYFKFALKIAASRALALLEMSEDNYAAAWWLLRDRYEDSDERIMHGII